MLYNSFRALLIGFCLIFFSAIANAQNQVIVEEGQRNIIVVGAKKTAQISGKVAVIVIKETANVGWEATKFTAKEVAAPIAKTLLLKAPSKVGKFALKRTLPASKKLIVSYLKYKLPL